MQDLKVKCSKELLFRVLKICKYYTVILFQLSRIKLFLHETATNQKATRTALAVYARSLCVLLRLKCLQAGSKNYCFIVPPRHQVHSKTEMLYAFSLGKSVNRATKRSKYP